MRTCELSHKIFFLLHIPSKCFCTFPLTDEIRLYMLFFYRKMWLAGTDLPVWGLRAEVFWGVPSSQTKRCGWLIDCSIVVSWLVEYKKNACIAGTVYIFNLNYNLKAKWSNNYILPINFFHLTVFFLRHEFFLQFPSTVSPTNWAIIFPRTKHLNMPI